MPAFVDTPEKEARWSKAKSAIERSKNKKEDSFTDQDWGLVNHIFHKCEDSLEKADYSKYLRAPGTKSDEAPKEDTEDYSSPEEDDTSDNYSYWGAKDPRAPGQAAPEKENKESAVAPSSRRQEGFSDEEIAKLKSLAPMWIHNMDTQRKHEADAKKNPILSAEGHKHRQLHEHMQDYHNDFKKKADSEDYQGSGFFGKLKHQLQHKQDWHKNNPDHHDGVLERIDKTKAMYGLANRAHLADRKEMLQDALTPGTGAMSAKEAAQHFGTKEGGEDDMPSVSTVGSATTSFGRHNPEIVRSELENLKDVKSLSPEEEEMLQDKGSKAPLLQHPAFKDPENKKLINDFYSVHGKSMSDENIRRQMKSLGIDEGLHQHIDMGKLTDAAMTGMLKGASAYKNDMGRTFGQHVHQTANNHVRSELQRQHTIAQSLRNKAKQAKKQPPAEEAGTTSAEPAKPAAPVKQFSPEEIAAMNAKYAAAGKNKVSAKPDIMSKMPSDMKERHQSIIAAKKTQGVE